jgi:hypothetical protein
MKLRAKASICIAFGLCIFCSGARAEGWDSIGPFGATLSNNDVISGQMNALAIDPRDANILYAGAAEGGVWKTSNGGASWTPLTDTQLVRKLASGKLEGTLSIGSLAVNPVTPDIVYAGTGDPNVACCFVGSGLGVFRSPGGGATWAATGLNANQTGCKMARSGRAWSIA